LWGDLFKILIIGKVKISNTGFIYLLMQEQREKLRGLPEKERGCIGVKASTSGKMGVWRMVWGGVRNFLGGFCGMLGREGKISYRGVYLTQGGEAVGEGCGGNPKTCIVEKDGGKDEI